MLAIVIPFYKIEFFEDTLLSLANQSNKKFKVYIGDDASPISPLSLLKKYKYRIAYNYVRFEENLGSKNLTAQWDRCLALTNDENWLLILGDDDYLGYNVVESFYNQFSNFNKKSNVVRFPSKLISEISGEISKTYYHPVWENVQTSYYKKFTGISRGSLSEFVFSKKKYLKIGFYAYPLGWYSDDRAWFDFNDSQMIYTINEATVYIRNSSLNISGRKDNLQLKNEAKHKFLRYLFNEKYSLFNLEQRIVLLREYENSILSYNEGNFQSFLSLLKLYILNFRWYEFKKFLKRVYYHKN